MVATIGLVGVRPAPSLAHRVTAPPYDVIKPGTPLEARLFAEPLSLVHVTLGKEPAASFARLRAEGALIDDEEPSYWVYEQRWSGGRRTGVLTAVEVTPYEAKQVIRHEKTFDDKVAGRMKLHKDTGHTLGPVFGLTRAPIEALLEEAIATLSPTYDFATDLGGLNDLHGIATRAFRVPEASPLGARLKAALAQEPAPAPRRDESRNEQPKLGSELGKKNAHVSPTPPLPPAAPCLQCSGTGRIYRSDGGWVRCPCQCPDGRCPKKK